VIRWTNILIGIQSSLIVLPVNIFIVFLFRRAAPSKAQKEADDEPDDDKSRTHDIVYNNNDPLNNLEMNSAQCTSTRSGDGIDSGAGHNFVDYTESGGLGVTYGSHRHSNMISRSALEITSPLFPKLLLTDSSRSFDESVFQIKHKIFDDDESSLQLKGNEEMLKKKDDFSCVFTPPQRKNEQVVSIDDVDICMYIIFLI